MLKIKTRFSSIKKRYELLRFGAGVSARRNLNRLFKIRDSIFFKKKLPESENYPYSVIDPFEVFGEDHPYCDFNLVGEDWKDKSNAKPLAILWGFNNWKLGFVSAYLPEYRTAFAPRKIRGLLALLAIRRFPIKPSVFIFWGYTEPYFVRKYAEFNEIKILRMEDGFLRSSALGATHSTPYSLLLDSRGMHYNPDASSELEEILNTYEFSEDELKAAEECMNLIKHLRLSKYNPATLGIEKDRGIKTRRKVAVLGQVDNDMAMRLGNPDGWSMTELIRLAKIENPDADVWYRPHPDVYKGIQRSRFKMKTVEKYCKLASPEVPLVNFLETLDQVYTVTSLSGFEALLRGVKVTVVGAAFYAGWGLTDDRLVFPNRIKLRSLLELFAAVYLKYPRYLANLSDSEVGFKAACYRILADRQFESNALADKDFVCNDSLDNLKVSQFWPKIFFGRSKSNVALDSSKIINDICFTDYLMGNVSKHFQRIYVIALCGKLANNESRNRLLIAVRSYLDIQVFNEVLLILSEYCPGNYIYTNLSWIFSREKDCLPAVDILKRRLNTLSTQPTCTELVNSADESFKDGLGVIDNNVEMSSDQIDILSTLVDARIERKDYKGAIQEAEIILVSGAGSYNILMKLAKVLELIFDYEGASQLARFCQSIGLSQENRRGIFCEISNFPTKPTVTDVERLKHLIALEVKLSPERINFSFGMASKYIEKKFSSIIQAMCFMDDSVSVNKAVALLEIGRADISKRILEKLFLLGESSDKAKVVYSKVLFELGMYDRALAIMNDARRLNPTDLNYRETLRILTYTGRFKESVALLEEAKLNKVSICDAVTISVYLGNSQIEEGYRAYTTVPFRDDLISYFGNKYKKSNDIFVDELLLLACYGPGDEVRFASIYRDLLALFTGGRVFITCDFRFETIFRRSFPGIDFVPTKRVRGYGPNHHREEYNLLPGSDLCSILDNSAMNIVDGVKELALVSDYIWHVRKNYSDFPGDAFLVCNHDLLVDFKSRLPRGKKLVGICWRSSLVTSARNVHYLSVSDLLPLFELDKFQFVNFQYDECQDELDYIDSHFPGALLDFPEIDHYNDFESVSALMKCMDLIIAPATSVAELSGALGCPTWLISNSCELHWRKIDDAGRDVWQNTITHVEGQVFGDKSSLVDELCSRLLKL